MNSAVKRPIGKNANSLRIRELQREAARVRTGRSMGVLYREGPGGTVYIAEAQPAQPTAGGVTYWL